MRLSAAAGLVRPATRDAQGAPDVVFQGQGRVWLAAPDSQIRQAMLHRMCALPPFEFLDPSQCLQG